MIKSSSYKGSSFYNPFIFLLSYTFAQKTFPIIEGSRICTFILSFDFLEKGKIEVKKENKFQSGLITELKERFPGAVVLKNDANYIQGFPDITILYKNHWAILECKRSKNEIHQPNQDIYVEQLNSMSYSSFIYPENKKEVLCKLTKLFSD